MAAFLVVDPYDPCRQSPLAIIQPSYWPHLQYTLEKQAALGTSSPSTVSVSYTNSTGGDYFGGVIGTNSKVYMIPNSQTAITAVDTATNTTSSFGNFPGTFKWAGGTLAPNGKIYGVPNTATSFLVIDPEAGSASTFNASAGSSDYFGAVLAPNGKIYAIPHNASGVAVIDPNTNGITTIGSLAANGTKYVGGVLAPNGKIYGIPYTATNVLVIDPGSGSVYTFPSPATGYLGGMLASNGKIYAHGTNTVLVIDPSNETVTSISVTAGVGFDGGAVAANGNIYSAANAPGNFAVFDPRTNISTNFGSVATSVYGGVLAPNGKIYTVPYGEPSIQIIDTGSHGRLCAPIVQSAYFNKF